MKQMELSGKRVLVFGAGRSGQGAASLLLAVGAEPVLYDGNEKMTEDKPVAREAGLIGGSALIGLGGGIGIKGLADKAPEIADKARETVVFKPAKKGEARIARWKDGSKQLEKVEKIHKAARKKAEGVQKFAKTKGGKAALIGIPTAIVGGVVYKSAKKKQKKSDSKKGEEK